MGLKTFLSKTVTGWDAWAADPPVPWDSWIPSCSCLEASVESCCSQYAKQKASFYSAFSAGRDQSSKWRGQRPPFWANSMPGWSNLLTNIIYLFIVYIHSFIQWNKWRSSLENQKLNIWLGCSLLVRRPRNSQLVTTSASSSKHLSNGAHNKNKLCTAQN